MTFLTPREMPPAEAIGAVLALGVFSTAVAYLLYFRLLERIGPTRTSTVTFLLPVSGVLLGALFLGEPITIGMIAGFAIVATGVTLVTGSHARGTVAVQTGGIRGVRDRLRRRIDRKSVHRRHA